MSEIRVVTYIAPDAHAGDRSQVVKFGAKRMNALASEINVKVLEVISHGLVAGVGVPIPGRMCVEEAVSFAMGFPHGDKPHCVAPAVRAFMVALNDSAWSTAQARAKGLSGIAIAQIGSNAIDQKLFVKEVARLTIRKIVPIALRTAAKIHSQEVHIKALEAAAVKCENDEDYRAAVESARRVSDAAIAATSYAVCYAAIDAADEANDARGAARAAVDAAAASGGDETFTMMAAIGEAALQLCTREIGELSQ